MSRITRPSALQSELQHAVHTRRTDNGQFTLRVWCAAAVVVACMLILVYRLTVLQVARHDAFKEQAESNRTAIVPIVPHRGSIIDRNGVVLASNFSAYTLELTPSEVDDLDETIAQLRQYIPITDREVSKFNKLRREVKPFSSVPLRSKLTDEEVAIMSAQLHQFKGVRVQARLFREYPYGETASHVIGYIGRINKKEQERIETWSDEERANYRGTNYIGKLGIEQFYEQQLHGVTGVEFMETSASGYATRKLSTTPPTPGNTIQLSLDIKLQQMVETLFGQRRGALVAIDPNNGEILAFVSKPTFDPNLFVDGISHKNWDALNTSIDKPLLNRALRGTYPPGSTYKPFMALAALTLGKRSASTVVNDPGYWMLGDHRFRGHGVGPVDMRKSIVKSSNVYYYTLANEMGVETMHDFMQPLTFGQLTGIDLKGEKAGVLPNRAWKRKKFRNPKQQKWIPGETISLGIGQGYNNFTILQVASATATLANGGTRYTPHLATQIRNSIDNTVVQKMRTQGVSLGYQPEHIQIIHDAMVGVTQEGTSQWVFNNASYLSAGKTGTAQAVTIGQKDRYDAKKLEEHQRDHSLYMAFAPAEKPQIALAIVVENAGFGAKHAAPIARRVFDYWLLGQYPNARDTAAVQKGQAYQPVGQPLLATKVDLTPSHATQETLFGSDTTN